MYIVNIYLLPVSLFNIAQNTMRTWCINIIMKSLLYKYHHEELGL